MSTTRRKNPDPALRPTRSVSPSSLFSHVCPSSPLLRLSIPRSYTVLYFVYEKVAPCGDYPPDGAVTFSNITVAFDGKNVTSGIKWTTS